MHHKNLSRSTMGQYHMNHKSVSVKRHVDAAHVNQRFSTCDIQPNTLRLLECASQLTKPKCKEFVDSQVKTVWQLRVIGGGSEIWTEQKVKNLYMYLYEEQTTLAWTQWHYIRKLFIVA